MMTRFTAALSALMAALTASSQSHSSVEHPPCTTHKNANSAIATTPAIMALVCFSTVLYPFLKSSNARTTRALLSQNQNVLFSQNQTIPQKPLELAIKPYSIVKSAKKG
ncbi:MAG: hypothetical protein HZC26_02700 [Candidatus Magasanikbacteria bacterium]|nr:hypothetical protein [Candidatus Magasanikbacteria bacterium]